MKMYPEEPTHSTTESESHGGTPRVRTDGQIVNLTHFDPF